jgi:hypothetical protein
MLGKISSDLENFRVPGKAIKVEFFSFLPRKKIGHFLTLEIFWHFENFILPDIYAHLMNVEEIFHFCPTILHTLEISSCLKTFGQFENFSVL